MKDAQSNLSIVCCIFDFGTGSKVLQFAREAGALGETIFLGKGTVKDKLLNFLGAIEKRKEILIAVVSSEVENIFYQGLRDRFRFAEPGKGIAFSLPLNYQLQIGGVKQRNEVRTKDVKKMAYEAIFVIVNKGLSVEVLEAAESAGSKGGTVIHGRGSGTKEKALLFNLEIEPEKDIVLILAKKSISEDITAAINEKLTIAEPGAGIVFALDVTRTLGLYEG